MQLFPHPEMVGERILDPSQTLQFSATLAKIFAIPSTGEAPAGQNGSHDYLLGV